MRVLSPAEAGLTQSLLSGQDPRAGVDALNRPIPRRTRETVLRRIYLREWISDRFVPNPRVIGRPLLTVALDRPYLEELGTLARRWASEEGAVHVWESRDVLFGAFLSTDSEAVHRLRRSIILGEYTRDTSFFTMDCREGPIPVYFDFEGAWAKLAGLTVSSTYPQSLPKTALGTTASVANSAPSLERIGGVVQSPILAASPGAGGENRRVASLGDIRRCIQRGWVDYRTFMDPVTTARTVTGFPPQLYFVRGRLIEGTTPPQLFRALVSRSYFTPFLFVHEGGQVLFGEVGQWAPHAGPEEWEEASDPILSLLSHHLTSILVVRMATAEMACPLNHRYDRLVDTSTTL